MLAMFGSLIFAGAFAAVVGVFAFTLVPALPRILALFRGQADPAHVTRPALVLSDRRIRARVPPMPVAARPRFQAQLQSQPQSMPFRAAA